MSYDLPKPPKPKPKQKKKPRPDGASYLAEPNKDGEIVRWRGASHSDKIAMKKWYRRQHAREEPETPLKPGDDYRIAFKNVGRARDTRAKQIRKENTRRTRIEKQARDGELRKPGALNAIAGVMFSSFILKLDRRRNTGYTGAELRVIRAEKGTGRPVHV